ncbi:MAG: hypothetical protein II002_05730, partial [Bacteroidales bacterium]|nr:hypothetical protein [Bacteroidales bacterium]
METLEVLKVALCQHDIVWENAPATIARLDAPVRRFCAQHPTDILVLPETFSVGFTMNHAVAESEDGPSATWLRRIAAECGVAVIASVPTRWTGPDGASHITNRCRFIEPDGTEVFYDKHHLFTPSGEYPAFEPGNRRCTVSYRGWRIGLNVCYDLLVNIANWPASRIDAAQILLRARAVENAAYALFCNRIGTDALCDYDGKSMILDYVGHSIARSCRVGGVRFFT